MCRERSVLCTVYYNVQREKCVMYIINSYTILTRLTPLVNDVII